MKVLYQILSGYTTGSFSFQEQDDLMETVTKQIKGVSVEINGYKIEDGTERWRAGFKYQDVQYFVWVNDSRKEEMIKLVETLQFM